jgi:hypothetical protein
VVGTGSTKVADPKAVRDAREWFEVKFPMGGQRGPGRDFDPGVSGCMGCNRGCHNRNLDHRGVERWKTAFYTFEGWDPKTGYPTRKTLEDLGVKHVADVLKANNRLGSAQVSSVQGSQRPPDSSR